MKLTKIGMKDVLSHEDVQVDAGKALTVFTGVSDSGKSTFLRGMRFALLNKPDGIDLLRHGAKRGSCSEVQVTIEDHEGTEHTVLRRRGKSRNEYEVDGATLKAFGLGSPEEVNRLLNLSDHAFQLQSDGHFLLSSTDGEIARVLGRTVGLDEIDTAFAEVRKIKSENDAALRHAQADVEREQGQVERFEGIEAVQALAQDVQKRNEQVGKLEERCALMRSLLNRAAVIPPDGAEHLTGAQERVNLALSLRDGIQTLSTSKEAAERLERAATAIQAPAHVGGASRCLETAMHLHDGTADLTGQIADMRRLLTVMDGIPGHVTEPDAVSTLLERVNSVQLEHGLVVKKQEVLSDTIRSLTALNVLCGRSGEGLAAVEQEYREFLRITPTCPECGSEQRYWATEETK